MELPHWGLLVEGEGETGDGGGERGVGQEDGVV